VKAVILAGGLGTRLSEETGLRPKPMVEIGGKPILWHIMKMYFSHGVTDFVICCGYKGYVIKEWFANYSLHLSDVTFDLKNGVSEVHQNGVEPWRVTLVDTGETTATGGRLKRVADYLDDEEFCFTYGDAVADVDLSSLITWHRDHGTLATVTAVQPPPRFGVLHVEGDRAVRFDEKPKEQAGWINGGFFVLSPEVIDYIDDDDMPWEHRPLQRLAAEGNLSAYQHAGFWQPMDTLRDKHRLEELWTSGRAPWRTW
jgi:glucose-1-phosphate cytidylyltransferase